MQYEKPIVLRLDGRTAAGQNPQACITGTNPSTGICMVGTNGGATLNDCYEGMSATFACLAGGSATFECGVGATPNIPGACTSGPGFVPN